jgi:hypothetical protein
MRFPRGAVSHSVGDEVIFSNPVSQYLSLVRSFITPDISRPAFFSRTLRANGTDLFAKAVGRKGDPHALLSVGKGTRLGTGRGFLSWLGGMGLFFRPSRSAW